MMVAVRKKHSMELAGCQILHQVTSDEEHSPRLCQSLHCFHMHAEEKQ